MGNFFYNLFNGKTGYTISGNMAVDEDGDLLMRLSDHTVMDMDTAPTAGQNDKREQRA